MQISPNVKYLTVFSDPEYIPELDDEGWNPWVRYDQKWVFEWDLDEGITFQVSSRKSKSFEWRPKTWHIYAPGERYRANYTYGKRKHENIWILFEIDKPAIHGIKRNLTVINDPESRIADVVRYMYNTQESGLPGHEELLRSQMQMILAEIRCSTFSQGEGTTDKPFVFNTLGETINLLEQSLLKKVDSIIVKNLYSPPNIDELASSLNMSVSSLSHRFRAETSWNIIQRVRWLRIQHAKKLLLQSGGHSGIKSTARKLGFSSPFYFSKVFKEVTGISPHEFLRLS
jgi:AraC-like DNA-binding protein